MDTPEIVVGTLADRWMGKYEYQAHDDEERYTSYTCNNFDCLLLVSIYKITVDATTQLTYL